MSSTANSDRVLIIGGGLGGLTLGQALRKRNIPFTIFERDDGDHSRVQGWAVALHENLALVRDNLPKDLGPLEQCSVSVNRPDKMASLAVYNSNGELQYASGGLSEDKPGYMVRCNRLRLRNYLAQHMDIQWNKYFTRYEETSDGVTAFFKDGTSYSGSIIVGADGAHSHVRSQLLGEEKSKLYTIPLATIIGEATLSREAYERQLKIATSLYIVDDEETRFFVGMRDVSVDKESATYYWICGCPDESFTQDSAHHWTRNTSNEELLQFVRKRVDKFPPHLKDIVEQTKSEGIVSPAIIIQDFVPPKALSTGRVTMLGDAAHAMAPFKGQGANQAIMDAIQIAKELEKGKNESSDVSATLRSYESEMIPRATEMVLASRTAAMKATGDDPRAMHRTIKA